MQEPASASMNRRRALGAICLTFVLPALFLTAAALRAAEPAVERPRAAAPVTVVDNGRTWTLDNGIVRATINKRSGNLSSIISPADNTLGGRGYWEQPPRDAPRLTPTVTIDPAKNGGRAGRGRRRQS